MTQQASWFPYQPFQVPEWTPSILRITIIGLVVPPGVGKFLTYTQSVNFFTSLGIPSPELMVLLVGAIELIAVGLLLVNKAWSLVATTLIPVMLVAIWTTQEWQAVAVLTASISLIALDVGLVRTPTEEQAT